MQKIKLLLISILITTLSSCGQTSNTEKTLKIESKTYECMTDWMTSKGVDWKELKSGFENYFVQGGSNQCVYGLEGPEINSALSL